MRYLCREADDQDLGDDVGNIASAANSLDDEEQEEPEIKRPLDARAPFPWFGGKRAAAEIVWSRFGLVKNYVKPFFGSGAVLLQRPDDLIYGTETVNDLDCHLANFWRALAADPDAVAHHANHPVNEADLHARHRWLVSRAEFRERMKRDPDYHDAKIAGWWVWGQCCWIGSGWCSAQSVPEVGEQIPTSGTQVEDSTASSPTSGTLDKVTPVVDCATTSAASARGWRGSGSRAGTGRGCSARA